MTLQLVLIISFQFSTMAYNLKVLSLVTALTAFCNIITIIASQHELKKLASHQIEITNARMLSLLYHFRYF